MNKNIEFMDSVLTLLNYSMEVKLPNGYTISNQGKKLHYTNGFESKIINEKDLEIIIDGFYFWETKNGGYIEVNNMSTSHIENSLNFQSKTIKRLGNSNLITDEMKQFSQIFTRILRDRNIRDILEEDNIDIGMDM